MTLVTMLWMVSLASLWSGLIFRLLVGIALRSVESAVFRVVPFASEVGIVN